MMQFTFESPKQFTRITTRLQRILQTTDIWRPCNSEGCYKKCELSGVRDCNVFGQRYTYWRENFRIPKWKRVLQGCSIC